MILEIKTSFNKLRPKQYFPIELYCVVLAAREGGMKPLSRRHGSRSLAKSLGHCTRQPGPSLSGSPGDGCTSDRPPGRLSEPERGIGGEATSEYFQSVSSFIKNSSRWKSDSVVIGRKMATSGLAKRCREILKTQASLAQKSNNNTSVVLFQIHTIVKR